MSVDWSNAPDGYPIWVESKVSTESSDWHRLESNGYLRDRKGARWEPWQVQDGECVPHYRPEWNGEGLPPAGIDAEFLGHNGDWLAGQYIGQFNGQMVVGCHTTGAVGFLSSEEFRPIRTAEQIAADERLHAISNACTSIAKIIEPYNLNLECSAAMRATVEAMIDAGYSKSP